MGAWNACMKATTKSQGAHHVNKGYSPYARRKVKAEGPSTKNVHLSLLSLSLTTFARNGSSFLPLAHKVATPSLLLLEEKLLLPLASLEDDPRGNDPS